MTKGSALDRLEARLGERAAKEAAGKRFRIFCIDDEQHNLDALERALKQAYEVHAFTSGTQALRAMQGGIKPDLLLTDQRMPDMTGIQLLQNSRTHCPNALRMIVSGYTERVDLLGAINEGHVDRYITKPWKPDDLRQAVAAGLSEYERRTQETEKSTQALATKVQRQEKELRDVRGQLQGALERLSRLSKSGDGE